MIVLRKYTDAEKEAFLEAFRRDPFSSDNPIIAMSASPFTGYPGQEFIDFHHTGHDYYIARDPVFRPSVWKRTKYGNEHYGYLPEGLFGIFTEDELMRICEESSPSWTRAGQKNS